MPMQRNASELSTLRQELKTVESEQRQCVGPLLARLEASLCLSVGPFDVGALERQLLPMIRGFGGSVRAQGLPHRLGELDYGTLQLVMAFASPESPDDVEARRKWAAVLLLVREEGQ